LQHPQELLPRFPERLAHHHDEVEIARRGIEAAHCGRSERERLAHRGDRVDRGRDLARVPLRPLVEMRLGHHHVSYAVRPAATVSRTRPVTR
jgi:hypothetical protein